MKRAASIFLGSCLAWALLAPCAGAEAQDADPVLERYQQRRGITRFTPTIEAEPQPTRYQLELGWAYEASGDDRSALAFAARARAAGASPLALEQLERYVAQGPDRRTSEAVFTAGIPLTILGVLGTVAGVVVRAVEDDPPCIVLCGSWGSGSSTPRPDNSASTAVLSIAVPVAALGIGLLIAGAVWRADLRRVVGEMQHPVALRVAPDGLRLDF